MVIDLVPCTVEFCPPAPLMNMNQRVHWREDRRRARAWRSAAYLYALEQLGRRSLGPSTVAISLPVAGQRRRDPHNYFPTVKHIVDGLVDAGLWPDDTPDWVTTIEPRLVTLPAAKAARALVTVTITPRLTE